MNAIQMTETGGPEVLQLVDIPDPTPGPGEILIKVESAAVNFADVTRRRGDPFDLPTPLPFTPGIEVAGTVVALGEGVEGPPVGSGVFGMAGVYANGAHHAVDYRGTGWTDDVLELTDGRGVDLALEMTGPEHLGETARILAPFGRLIVFGAVAGRADTHVNGADLDAILYAPAFGQAISGFNLTSWFIHRLEPTIAALQRLVGWIADGTIAGPPIQAYPLADAAETHRLLETGASTGKLILKP
jgi:NADPH:quinone reductase-like Zn-dependent oxidoreductase